MSGFLGTTGGDDGGIPFGAHDLRIVAEAFTVDFELLPAAAWSLDGMRSQWWPRGGSLDASSGDMLEAASYDRPDLTRGRNSRVIVSGYTRDAYGSPLASCVVKLFRTSDDVKQDQATSDPTGYFALASPYYPDPHYLVSYKAGSPDVEGTSVNTLIGS